MKASVDNMTTGQRTTRPPSCQWSVVSGLAVAFLLCASATTAHGQIYWDNVSGNGVGGNGSWTVGGNNWNTASTGEDATLTTWANGDSAVFAGTAGVVTITSGTAISASSVEVSTTGYEITSGFVGRGLTITNALTLDSNVSLKLTLDSGTSGTNPTVWSFGSISAASGAALILNAGDTTINASNRLNITTATTVSVPITITAGASALGATGIVANGAAVTLSSDITNNSASATMLGATANSTLTYTGKITGTAGLTFTLQNNGSGLGTVIMDSNTNDYTGATTILNSLSGLTKLGINNAFPSSTALVFGGNGVAQVGALDLNGHNLTVGSLSTNASTTANGITNTNGSTLSTLTINGSATTTYASIIGVPTLSPVTNASNNIALALAATNTGTLTLSGANTYFGGTTISGGTLIVSGSGTLGTGNVSLTAAHVTLTLSGTTQIASTATLSYVNMDTINLNYSGTDTIAGLLVDGVPEAPGIYGATAINPDGVFFGSGTVTVVPEPTTVGMMLLGAGLLAGVQRFRRK